MFDYIELNELWGTVSLHEQELSKLRCKIQNDWLVLRQINFMKPHDGQDRRKRLLYRKEDEFSFHFNILRSGWKSNLKYFVTTQ